MYDSVTAYVIHQSTILHTHTYTHTHTHTHKHDHDHQLFARIFLFGSVHLLQLAIRSPLVYYIHRSLRFLSKLSPIPNRLSWPTTTLLVFLGTERTSSSAFLQFGSVCVSRTCAGTKLVFSKYARQSFETFPTT